MTMFFLSLEVWQLLKRVPHGESYLPSRVLTFCGGPDTVYPYALIFKDMDLIMLTLFNAREREEADWIELFIRADRQLSNAKIWTPEGVAM